MDGPYRSIASPPTMSWWSRVRKVSHFLWEDPIGDLTIIPLVLGYYAAIGVAALLLVFTTGAWIWFLGRSFIGYSADVVLLDCLFYGLAFWAGLLWSVVLIVLGCAIVRDTRSWFEQLRHAWYQPDNGEV